MNLGYNHILFDLDRTLWDFETNSCLTLAEMHGEYALYELGKCTAADFIRVYRKINEELWNRYRRGEIEKSCLRSGRFAKALSEAGIHDEPLAMEMAEEYLRRCPRKVGLITGASELLDYLAGRDYFLHIMTNGFEDVQQKKIKNSRLDGYFNHIITSDRAGAKKPDKQAFFYALKTISANPEECLMVGDDLEADVMGAKAVGVDQVYFNPHETSPEIEPTFHIRSLLQLSDLL